MEKKTKVCKYCKETIDKSAKRCPKCGGKQGLPGWVKAIIIILIIIICIVGCVNSCSNGVENAVKETKDEWQDINGKTSFNVNESFQNKYEKITMIEVNTNFTDYGQYSSPTEGYKYVMAKFEVENINEEKDELYVSSYDFNADADGVSVESGYVGNDNYKDLNATLGIGKKAIGYLFYEVPISASKVTINYNPNFWVDGNSIEFVVQ